MTITSINDIAAALTDAMYLEVSVTSSTTATSLDCATAATTTAATTTAPTTNEASASAATSTAANTTTVDMYANSPDITTIPSDPSPVSLSSATQSQLSRDFFPNSPVGSLQEAMEIAAGELPPQSQSNFRLKIYNLFAEITDDAIAQVTWRLNLAARDLDSKQFQYKQYSDFFKALDISGRLRKMIKQHHSAQQRKTQATKKLGDLWQHYHEIHEIWSDSRGSENSMRLTVIANQPSRDLGLGNRCLNRAYLNHLTKPNQKLKANKWFTSGDIQEAEPFLDKGCPQLGEGIDYKAMGLKWYRR